MAKIYEWVLIKDPCEYPLSSEIGLNRYEVFYGAKTGGLVDGTILSRKGVLHKVQDGNVIKIDGTMIGSKDELSYKRIKGTKWRLPHNSSRKLAKEEG